MRSTSWLVVFCAFAALPSFASGPLEDVFYRGKVVPLYGKASTPRQQAILDKFREEHLAETLAKTVQDTVRLKRSLGIGFKSCGAPNAFYDRQKSTITFCLEMIELIVNQVDADPQLAGAGKLEVQQKVVVGAVYGILLHELGHAVLDINQVPITGREEDVADQFALYYATKIIEPVGVSIILATIWFFHTLEKRHDLASEEVIKRVMADEHSLDAQRTYNLACWALGANSGAGARAAKFVGLPEERARRCPNEYARLDFAMRTLFGKYLVVGRS